jgi:Ca2+-binding EF-hand superfamily protein
MRYLKMGEESGHTRRGNDDCKVSKTQLLRFIEAKFQMADRYQDGQLDITELSNFLRFVTHPDLRSLRSWER